MPNSHRYRGIAEALDDAQRMLVERFGSADQEAAVQLALSLYSMQERERFDERQGEQEVPYRA